MGEPALPPEALRRVEADRLAWLATVTPKGVPFPTPVWFAPDGPDLLVFASPGSRKVANVARHPLVTLHFETDEQGGDVVVITGEAALDDGGLSPATHQPYREKYEAGMAQVAGSVQRFDAVYSQAIRVRPLRAWVQPE